MSDVTGTATTGHPGASRDDRLWKLGRWPNAPQIGHLVFLDHLSLPTPGALDTAIAAARSRGLDAVRTSALFPRAADVVAGHGFVPIDRLALLRIALDDQLDRALEARYGTHRPRTRPLRPWHHTAAAAVDQAAFGIEWGNDPASLAEIRSATPSHRARMVRAGREIAGFAIAGASADSGYVQRLAVAPAHRRRGIARDLVVDALDWMRRRGASTAFVNTGVDNDGALSLYRGLGFVRLQDELTIAELRLAT